MFKQQLDIYLLIYFIIIIHCYKYSLYSNIHNLPEYRYYYYNLPEYYYYYQNYSHYNLNYFDFDFDFDYDYDLNYDNLDNHFDVTIYNK